MAPVYRHLAGFGQPLFINFVAGHAFEDFVFCRRIFFDALAGQASVFRRPGA